MNQKATRRTTVRAALAILVALAMTFLIGPIPKAHAANPDPQSVLNTVEQWWQGQAASAGGNLSPIMTQQLLAQAQPDECFNGAGEPYTGTGDPLNCPTPPTQVGTDPSTGQPVYSGEKINQAYVWGLTEANDTLYFGTAANVECLVMGAYLGLTVPQINDSYACEFGQSQYAQNLGKYFTTLSGLGYLTTDQLNLFKNMANAAGDWRPPHAYSEPAGTAPATPTPLDPGTLLGFAPTTGMPIIQANGTASALDAARFVFTIGLRSAGTLNGVVFLAGPALLPDAVLPVGAGADVQPQIASDAAPGVNMFAFDAATGDFLGSQNFPAYSDIRQWIVNDGKLYTAAGSTVLQWTPPAEITSPADYFDFTPVATLPNEQASNLAVLNNHLYVSTWPLALSIMQTPGACDSNPTDVASCGVAGVWMSPTIDPTTGLAGAAVADSTGWAKVWSALNYEPDPVIARTYAMGAIRAYDGQLYWGTMHVPFLSTLALFRYWFAPTGQGGQGLSFSADPTTQQAEMLALMVASQRSISVFRGSGYDQDNGNTQLLYGDSLLPAFGPSPLGTFTDAGDNTYGWTLQPNATGGPALYGSSGFGNPFNNYTWSMNVFGGHLFVGTMDWSYLALKELPTIVSMMGSSGGLNIQLDPVTVQTALLPLAWNPGADLWRFDGSSVPAVAEDLTGLGDYGSYGVRTMVSDDQNLYVGMANPMNLMVTNPAQQDLAMHANVALPLPMPPDWGPGGWQLLALSPDHNAAPTVTAVTPNSGTTAGGDTVTVTGTHFVGATEVDFGAGNPAPGGFVVGPGGQSIVVTTPSGAAGPVHVTVTTKWGTSSTSSADLFTYVAPTPPPPPPVIVPGGGGTTPPGGSTNLGPVTRTAGSDRIATAIAASQALANGKAGAVVLADGYDFPDALAGSALAIAKDAPMLLTDGVNLPASVSTEIQRVLPAGGTVYVLGGNAAQSDNIVTQAQALGYNVVRLGGADRYATAALIASAVGPVSQVLLANGVNFPDAVSASAVPGVVAGTVILLTNGNTLPAATASFDAARPAARFAIGGPAAKADPAATPLVGADRYATSVLVAQRFFSSPTAVGLATGTDFADALAGGVMVGPQGEPLVLTDPANLPASVSQYLTGLRPGLTHVDVFGGTGAVSFNVETAVNTILAH